MIKLVNLILLFSSLSFYGQVQNDILFADRSIDNKLELLRSEGIMKYLGDQKDKLIDDEKPSRVVFCSADNSQYLIAYHLCGANANTFNLFEVGRSNENQTCGHTTFGSFKTDGGISLGLEMAKLIEYKGKKYTKTKEDGFTVLHYKTDDPNSRVIRDYDMPLYTADYYFRDNKLEKFIFGFPNL